MAVADVSNETRRIAVEPIAGALGAEISGVDLAQLDDETFAEIHAAWLRHRVIFFRDQNLRPEDQIAFGRRFGDLVVHPFVRPLDGYPEIIPIIKEPGDRANFGGGWHTDVTFLEKPAMASLLYALETPEVGGDTLWANQTLAYETLSDGLKRTLDGLVAIHSAGPQYGRESESSRNRDKRSSMETAVTDDAEATVEHPVVRTHPETGLKGLFVNPGFTLKFKGWKTRESKPLLEYLYRHSVREDFTCRFRWRPGSVALWDNRCTQHFALNDYPGRRREMHRVTIEGDRPR